MRLSRTPDTSPSHCRTFSTPGQMFPRSTRLSNLKCIVLRKSNGTGTWLKIKKIIYSHIAAYLMLWITKCRNPILRSSPQETQSIKYYRYKLEPQKYVNKSIDYKLTQKTHKNLILTAYYYMYILWHLVTSVYSVVAFVTSNLMVFVN